MCSLGPFCEDVHSHVETPSTALTGDVLDAAIFYLDELTSMYGDAHWDWALGELKATTIELANLCLRIGHKADMMDDVIFRLLYAISRREPVTMQRQATQLEQVARQVSPEWSSSVWNDWKIGFVRCVTLMRSGEFAQAEANYKSLLRHIETEAGSVATISGDMRNRFKKWAQHGIDSASKRKRDQEKQESGGLLGETFRFFLATLRKRSRAT